MRHLHEVNGECSRGDFVIARSLPRKIFVILDIAGIKRRGIPLCKLKPNAWLKTTPASRDHQNGVQPPCPSRCDFSIYLSWRIRVHSEPPICEIREIQ